MEGVGVAIAAIFHITAPAKLLAGALPALGRIGGTPILAETPLSGVIKIWPEKRVIVFALDLPEGVRVETWVADIEPLVVLRRHGSHWTLLFIYCFMDLFFIPRKKNECPVD